MRVKRELNIVLALIISLILWVYVFGQSNSTIKTTIKDIPISIENASELSADGLAIGNMEAQTVSITFSGRRVITSKLTQNDFIVSCDASGLKEGVTTLRLNVVAPEDVTVSSISHQSIKVEVEEEDTLEKDIIVDVINDNSDDTEPYVVQLSTEKVDVTGAKSLIKQVDSVVATLDTKKVTNEMQAFNSALVPVDKYGKEINGLSLSVQNVSITAKLANKKTVDLVTEVIGEDKAKLGRTAECPKAVTIKGDEEALSKVDKIIAEPLDISNIYESTVIPFKLEMPDGVMLAADSQRVGATITVDKAGIKEFEFHETDIIANGIEEGTTVTISKVTIKVSVAGQSTVLNSLTKDDINLSIDSTGLYWGTYVVDLNISCNKETSLLEADVKEVEVYVE